MTEGSDKPVQARKVGKVDKEPAEAPDAGEESVAVKADGESPVAADEAADRGDDTDVDEVADPDEGAKPSKAALASGALEQVSRPVEMYVGALFLTLAALTPIFLGAMLALQIGPVGENLRQQISASGTGLDVGTLIVLFRIAGALLLIVGLLFVAFAWTALKPKRWARMGATVLAVIEILLLIGAMVVTTVDPVSLGIVLVAGAGVALLYLPRSEEFLLTSR